MANLKNLPLMDLSGAATYEDPSYVKRDWLAENGYYRTRVVEIDAKQGKGTKDKPGNFSYIPKLVVTDEDAKGKQLAAWLTFTGVISKGPQKGKSNAEVFVPPFMRACGMSKEEVHERSVPEYSPADFIEEFTGKECLVRVFETKDRRRKRIAQKLAFVTPEDFASALEGGPSVMRAPISKALAAQIEGSDEPDEVDDTDGGETDQEVDY